MEMCAVSCGCEHTHTVEEETMCSLSWVWGHSYLSKRQNCFFYMPYIITVTMATGQLAECQSAAFFCMCASLQIKCRSAEFGAVHIANRASLSLCACIYVSLSVLSSVVATVCCPNTHKGFGLPARFPQFSANSTWTFTKRPNYFAVSYLLSVVQ